MVHDPAVYLAAAVGVASTTAATVSSSPELAMGGVGVGGVAGLVVVLWRLANLATRQLEQMDQHRRLQAEQWKRAEAHRDAEKDHWRALSSAKL